MSSDKKTKKVCTDEMMRGTWYAKIAITVPKEARPTIDDSDLVGKGLETDFHVTIAKLIPNSQSEQEPKVSVPHKPVLKVAEGAEAFFVQLGKLGVFENEKEDVLYIAVDKKESSSLFALHTNLQAADERMPEWPHDEFNPHITLAYLKPGVGKKYVERQTGLEGKRVYVPLLHLVKYKDKSVPQVSFLLAQK